MLQDPQADAALCGRLVTRTTGRAPRLKRAIKTAAPIVVKGIVQGGISWAMNHHDQVIGAVRWVVDLII